MNALPLNCEMFDSKVAQKPTSLVCMSKVDYYKVKAVELHKNLRGKIETKVRAEANTAEDLSLAYSPGVAYPCLEIKDNVDKVYDYTRRWNTIAVVTDGTAVLGLGDIGPEAAMPVMEGKCLLFKRFGDVDAVPLCVRSKKVDDIVNVVKLLAGSFGGVNLEDISAPRCFEIERRLKQETDIPIFHDDQHGTAIVTLAALFNALKIVKKDIKNIKVVTAGAGAAGFAIVNLLVEVGVNPANVILTDTKGAIYKGRDFGGNKYKEEIAEVTNKGCVKGSLAECMKGADVFIGVSGPGIVTTEMVKSMAKDPIVFPMANPIPEILPDEAKAGGAAVVGTGRSDFPNQINNVLAFPAIFRGVFDCRAKEVNSAMNIAAAKAIASLVSDSELKPDYIIPKAFDERIKDAVAKAVVEAAKKTGVARK